ncbi:MAG: hypothetical protein M3Y59_19460 [Myxococcota bacterium]|nr:hypothetical protein [Myxococcota bacterium]
MAWSTAYLGAFLFGLMFVATTTLLGHFGGGGDGAGHGDADAGDLAHDMSDGVQGAHLPVFSPSVLAVFVTVFGASGYVLTQHLGVTDPLLHVSGASALSLASGLSVAWFMMKLMQVAETNSFSSHASVVGSTVEVTQAIRGKEFGEIAYLAGGARQTLIAKSLHEESFDQGAFVQVASVVDGTALVGPVGSESLIQSAVSPVATGTPVHSIQQKTR